MQGQAACPFLLPLLTQLADPLELAALQKQAEQTGDLGWPACLRQPQVGMHSSLLQLHSWDVTCMLGT